VNQQMHTGKICCNIYYYHLHVSVDFVANIRVVLRNTDKI